jgi:predicted membrane protein
MNTMNFYPVFPFLWMIQRFWVPAMFFGIGALLLSRRTGQNGVGGGVFFMLLGFLFFLGALGIWDFSYSRWVGPAILIWIGVALLMRNQRARPIPPPRDDSPKSDSRFEPGMRGVDQYTDSRDFIHATVILGAFNRRCPSQKFRGGDLTAIMGGGKVDLRDAQIQEKEAVLDIFTLMGGLEIQVPSGWTVEPRFTPILGGYQDRTTRVSESNQRLVINGTAIMGSVTVFN